MPAQARRTLRSGRGAGPIHDSWVIVGFLVVVQVIGSAISQSAGVMVAPLRDPRGDFGWGIGTIGALMAVYYFVGGLFAPVSGGLGAALLAPLVGYLLDRLGWQGTFWSLGAVGGGVILSLTLLYRDRPGDLGLTPYGVTADDPPEVVRSPAFERLRRQVFARHMRRTRAFWHLPLIHGLGCAGHGIVLLYVVLPGG